MKCLNPACESIAADEINVSVNATSTEELDGPVQYTGDTEYGDCSDGIGTYCSECGMTVYVSYWKDIVVSWSDHRALVLTPELDPWTFTCTKCRKTTVPTRGMECLECEA